MRWLTVASGLVTAMMMKKLAQRALEEKNFSPLMTHSSPSRTARVVNTAGSAPPCGSVIEKQDTMSPSSSGSRYLLFCSGVP